MAQQEMPVQMTVVGDVNLQGRECPSEAFTLVEEELRDADVVCGNLEGCFFDAEESIAAKTGWHHSDKRMVKGLVHAGFDVVWCANNVHFGERAVMESLGVLDKNKISHAGAGANWEEARKPAVLKRRGTRFGFLAYSSVFHPVGQAAGPDSPGIATVRGVTYYEPHPRVFEMPGAPARTISFPDPVELGAMKEDIRRLRSRVDVLTVAFHWGVSSRTELAMYQPTLGHEAVDAGADLVVGQHPHVPQAVEIYKGRPIFYSLGNFAFDWERMHHRRDGLLVRCLWKGGEPFRVSFLPIQRNDSGQPRVLNPEEGAGILSSVEGLSREFGTQFERSGNETVVLQKSTKVSL